MLQKVSKVVALLVGSILAGWSQSKPLCSLRNKEF
jgi:hypothetical protein